MIQTGICIITIYSFRKSIGINRLLIFSLTLIFPFTITEIVVQI